MSELSFFTPVMYTSPSKSIGMSVQEKVDNYFYLGGKKAQVIQGFTKSGKEKVILVDAKSSLLARVAIVLSYFSGVLPLFMLLLKVALHSRHCYKVIDPKQKIEKGMNISEATAVKIQQLIPTIIRREDDEALEWLTKGNNLVFKVRENPNIVFKMAPPGGSVLRDGKSLDSKAVSDERFNNMVKAKEVCIANDLGLLIIPHAKKFEVKFSGETYTLIAEESLDFNPAESAHEELYHKYSTELNETARQLAVLVAKTGFNDVTWRNIPLLNEMTGFQGPRRVALIDLEHMGSAKNGFLGDGNGSCGLIRCVSEAQIDLVIAEAGKHGVSFTNEQAEEAKKRRLEELESDKKLRILYEKNGIITGREPIQVDLNSLGLDLREEGQISVFVGVEEGTLKWERQTVSLRKVAEEVISEINRRIQRSSDQASTKGKRYFYLDTNVDPIKAFNNLGLPPEKVFINKEEEKQLWLLRIIEALVDKGYIHKLDKVNGNGYFIQA